MSHRFPRRRMAFVASVVALVSGTAVTTVTGVGATTPAPTAGSAGVASSLPSTSSAVTVHGSGYFSNLSVTVNQTQDLVNQAISVTWSGCTAAAPYASGCGPTFSDSSGDFSGDYAGNYLQMFECWTNPQTNQAVTPAQCEFGGESNTPTSSYPIHSPGYMYSRVISQPGWADDPVTGGYVDTSQGGLDIEPFEAVDGTVVDEQANYNYLNSTPPGAFWQNPYFSFNTTNEVDFSRIYPDGTGSQLFTVDTGLEAPGLGCGQDIEPGTGGADVTPDCWLVIVPRGLPSAENPQGVIDEKQIYTSPLDPTGAAWADKIVVPLKFVPIGASCQIGSDEVRIAGSELASQAVGNWQPTLCAQKDSPPYNYSYLSDSLARQELLAGATQGGPGMAIMSDPISPSKVTSTNPVVYAPLTLSSVDIAFNIDRQPSLTESGDPQPSEVPLAGQRIANINLTPRLVAKLLTESYSGQFYGLNLHSPPSGYSWVVDNPESLFSDPDFLQYNPEFQLLQSSQLIDSGTLVLEEPSSDAAEALWGWILSDPSAKAWLDGTPDPWGMRVNPLYSTSATENPSGVGFGSPVPDSFPKSDPYCYDDTGVTVGDPPQQVDPLCFQSWSPYVLTMEAAATAAATANDQAKTTGNPGAVNVDSYWSSNGPQVAGSDVVMAITDSASAQRYGLQVASLSPSGDDSDPTFVTPSDTTVLAGEKAMVSSGVAGVLKANPAATGGAYPLPMLTYAALQPLSLTKALRTDYAKFIDYAAGPGQVSGYATGQLPPGYTPLPKALQSAALAAATQVVTLGTTKPATTKATTTTSPPTTGVSTAPTGGSSRTGDSGSGTALPGSTASPVGAVSHPTGSSQSRTVPTVVSSGQVAAVLARTEATSVPAIRWAVPVGLGTGVIAGLLAPLVGRRRLRRQDDKDDVIRIW